MGTSTTVGETPSDLRNGEIVQLQRRMTELAADNRTLQSFAEALTRQLDEEQSLALQREHLLKKRIQSLEAELKNVSRYELRFSFFRFPLFVRARYSSRHKSMLSILKCDTTE
jgi:hypothetical protein